jgi:cholera toxin transcriptional activator
LQTDLTTVKYRFGEFEADVRAAELRKNGTRLKLQLQPFQVLLALLQRPNEVVTREELRQRLWPEDTFVDFDHSLNTAIAKLRDALGDSASEPRYVETIAKRGYRFLGSPEQLAEAASPAPETVPAERCLPRKAQPGAESGVADEHLPRASRATSRTLFILAQVMYLIFYLSALFNLENLARSTDMAWKHAGRAAFVVYLLTALIGVVVRLYLITATAFDYHLLEKKYRVLFPALLALDMIWAMGPFLLADRIGMGLALGATAALLYMPFAQRVLMKMIARRV